MKNFFLFSFTLSLVLILGCQKSETQNNINAQREQPTTLRSDLEEIAVDVATDSIFRDLIDSSLFLQAIVMADTALCDSLVAKSFFEDGKEAESISDISLLLNTYNFNTSTSTKIISKINNVNVNYSVVLVNFDLESLSENDRLYVMSTAAGIVLDDYTNNESELECCQRYRKALADCASTAVLWIAGAWSGSVGIIFLPAWPDVLSSLWRCVRIADNEYKNCCPK